MDNKLTLESASRIADGVLKAARAANYAPLAVAVLDAGGHVIVLKREDGAGFLRPDIARAKAWGALGLGLGTRAMEEVAQRVPQLAQALTVISEGRIFPAPGGLLIRDDAGRILGAVGVSGDTSDNDEAAAIQGLKAAGFSADVQ